MSVLVLNASYEPLVVVSWKRAITLVFAGRAEMVEQDGDQVIRSAGGAEFPRPRVVRLFHMVTFASMRSRRVPVFSKAGLIARDNATCQVKHCDAVGETIDHVIPKSQGGSTNWENCVLMCAVHNSVKGSRTLVELAWELKRVPRQPSTTIIMQTVANRPEWHRWVTQTAT